MNKRSFLFVSLVGTAFVACQCFFGYNDFKSCKQLAEKQKTISEYVLAATESLGLGVVSWTDSLDKNGDEGHYAVRFGKNLLLLNRDKCVDSVYASDAVWELVEQTTAFDNIRIGLYEDSTQRTDGTRMDKVFLPSGDEGLPVLAVEFRNGREPIVFLGEYKQGKLLNKDSTVFGTSLVFWRSGNEYIPLGIYDSRSSRLESLDLPLSKAAVFASTKAAESEQNQYFVLANDYMQLVVSQESGSVEGINLPFASSNDISVVNEIGVDRDLVSQSSHAAFFPGVMAKDGKNELVTNEIGGFYPLLRRGDLSKSGKPISSQFHALNLVSGRELSSPIASGFRVVSFDNQKLVLESNNGSVTKIYSLQNDLPYTFEIEVRLNQANDDLWITSGVPEVEIMSNAFVPSVKYRSLKKNKAELSNVKLPKAKEPVSVKSGVYPQWIVNANGYFGIILTPLSDLPAGYASSYIPGSVVPTRLSDLNPKNQAYPASKYPGYMTMLPLPKEEGSSRFLVYAGPLSDPTLRALDKARTDSRGESPEYLDCITFRGFFAFITEPFAALLFIIMKFFKMVSGSWGISIILLTVFLKLLLYPLNAWSIRSMRRMQILSPYIQEVQQKYKREPKRAQMEIMALYKANKVNPITGCLPLLIQLPFLIAMFDLLKSSFLLRGASFIPGWIDNLTAPDVLFSWSTPIWFIGNEFHLLPILLGVVMLAQQKVSAAKRSKVMTEQQRQQEAMGTMMALLFTFMFYNFPSGLNIYWFSSMLLGVIQQWVTNKILDSKHLKNEVILNKKK